MSDPVGVSNPVIRRLPRYYRYLNDLLHSGKYRISSNELASKMGLTASQIRHDLNCFGGFGQQGYGYNVEQLASEIEKILYLDTRIPTILIGVGNLGRALVSFVEHDAPGVSLIGLFDKEPASVLNLRSSLAVRSTDELPQFCADNKPVLAILCIPGENAPQLAEKLTRLGIRGFWNFTHVDLHVSNEVSVENVHLGDSLMTLGFMVNARK